MKNNLKTNLIIAVISSAFAVAAIIWSETASAQEVVVEEPAVELSPQEKVEACARDTALTAYAYGGGYGAALGGVGGVVALMLTPAGTFTAVAGSIYVGLNIISGGALGVGATALSMIGTESVHDNYIVELCIDKVAKEELSSQIETSRNYLRNFFSQ